MQIYSLHQSPVAIARRRLGLSRAEAARILGVAPGHIRLVESQTRRIAMPVLAYIVEQLEAAAEDSGGTGILFFPDHVGDDHVAR